MEFSRQEYWNGLPFHFPGNLPNPGIKPVSLVSPTLAGGFFTTEPAENLVQMVAAGAKSLQSCLTLCDPTDGSPPGSPAVPGILQARTLEWVAIFLLQCMKVKSEREVAQSCLTVSDPMDCSLPSFSIHGIFQARVLEWDAIAFSERKVIQPQMSVVLGMRSPTLN